jgi:hypothetical protein
MKQTNKPTTDEDGREIIIVDTKKSYRLIGGKNADYTAIMEITPGGNKFAIDIHSICDGIYVTPQHECRKCGKDFWKTTVGGQETCPECKVRS